MAGLKIRVLTGCQMDGLVCALRILFPGADVEGFHSYKLLGDERAEIHDDLRTADVVFALPLESKFADLAYDRIGRLGPKIQFVPHVVFSAFHPDITYLERLDGSRVQTPMTDYHSIIALTAYLMDFDVDRTVRLYNAYVYQALGYFDLAESSRQSLLTDFAFHKIDLTAASARWLKQTSPFMYSMNHPKSFVLADVALEASRATGLWDDRPAPSFDLIQDHLSRWIVYPVFKEIAARLGKVGSYRFKLIGSDEAAAMSLEEFVRRSFDGYAREDASRWVLSTRTVATRATIASLADRSRGFRSMPAISDPRRMSMMFVEPKHVDSVEECYFYHTTELPKLGLQQGPWDLRGRFSDYIGGLDLTGLRVLDVGAASGFLTFSAEEAGAKEVVSFDLDTADRQHLLPFAGSEYVTDHKRWSAKQTAGFQRWKNAYWLTHRLRQSKAKAVYGDIYSLPEMIGQFDVVILGAILEHLADPIRALASVAKFADFYIVINTDFVDTEEPMARFNGRPDLPDASYVFWTYSIKTYEHIMGILDFEIVAVKKNKFAARDANGISALERVALVCRRKRRAVEALRKVA